MLQEKVVRGKFFGRLKKNISQGNSSWLGVTNPNSKSKYSARMLQEGGALKKNWEMYLTSPTA
ncbi:MAG: hypothetical protein KAX49_16940, partial [Halanaerobiales bacterium]|nr:hypothetical protein [Halanaerobiales bacterium]